MRHYSPDELAGFGFIDKGLHFEPVYMTIRSISPDSRIKRFAKKMVAGHTTLYRLQLPQQELSQEYLKDNAHVYILKKDTAFYTLAQYEVSTNNGVRFEKRYIGLLIYLLNDCPGIASSSFKRLAFKDEAMAQLITQYNACKDPSTASVEHTYKVKAEVKWGPEAGYTHVFAPDNITFLDGRGFWGGVFWDITKPDISRKLSTRVGLNYLHLNYNYTAHSRDGYPAKPYTVAEQMHMLRLPLQVQYNFNNAPEKRLSPFLSFGLTPQFSANSALKDIDMVPFLNFGAGAYIQQYKVSVSVENMGFGFKSDKIISLGVGYVLKKRNKKH